jgi:hypothetical protein
MRRGRNLVLIVRLSIEASTDGALSVEKYTRYWLELKSLSFGDDQEMMS